MKIVLALNKSEHSLKALEHTVKLCKSLKHYNLQIINIVALNPKTTLPIFDEIDIASNIEITEKSENERKWCEQMIKQECDVIKYEFLQLEGEGEVGLVLKQYIDENSLELDLIVMGSSHKGSIEKYIVGSTPDYCLANIPVPLTLVKHLDNKTV